MFENVEALDRSKHQNLKFTPASGYFFAKDLSMVPLSYTEMVRASRHFPIIFPSQDRQIPYSLLSLQKGKNAFVDQNGNWLTPYVPAHIRRYPFVLAKTDEEGNYAVCIDPQAPQFNTDQGDPLYTANLEPSDFLNRTIEFLKQYHKEMLGTERIFAPLQQRELLAEKQFNLGRGEQQATVRGFRAVDANKLGEMDNETLGSWVKRGILGLVYAHLYSLDNVRKLAETEKQAAAG